FVHLELDRHLAAQSRRAEWHLELRFDVGAALRTAGSRAAIAAAEHGAEQVSQPAQANVAKILEAKVLSAGTGPRSTRSEWRAGRTAATTGSAAKTAECAQLTHLVVLLPLVRVAQYLIRLRDLLEALGGFWVGGVFVRV